MERPEIISAFGVESLLTVECARAIIQHMDEIEQSKPITLEQTFAGIVEFSGKLVRRGPVRKAERKIRGKQAGRVDLVLWNAGGTPRVMVEIKRKSGRQGLEADAVRIIDFLESFGKIGGGSLRYGLVATLFHRRGNRTKAQVETMVKTRGDALTKLVKTKGAAVSWGSAEWIAIPDYSDEGEERVCSVVYCFT